MDAHGETSCPEVVLASIAWYPDALSEERRGLVEAHAAQCPACRDEIACVRGEREPEGVPSDAERVYARVLARIEDHEAGLRGGSVRADGPRAPRSRPARRGLFGARPAALAAGLAVALLCGAVGVVGGLWLGAGTAPRYQTAADTGPAASAPAAAPALDVVFRPEARSEAIHAALRAIGGQIVSGPTQLGVYRVTLGPSADVAAAARLLRGDGQGVASFAEPSPR